MKGSVVMGWGSSSSLCASCDLHPQLKIAIYVKEVGLSEIPSTIHNEIGVVLVLHN